MSQRKQKKTNKKKVIKELFLAWNIHMAIMDSVKLSEKHKNIYKKLRFFTKKKECDFWKKYKKVGESRRWRVSLFVVRPYVRAYVRTYVGVFKMFY